MAPPSPVTVIGSYISPYVRKLLVCLHLKEIPYRIDPIVPFFGNDEFSRISPLRRIPVLIDDAVTLADSTVICEYLDDRYPGQALLPADPVARAHARWLEEYADTRMGEVIIWRLFNQRVINPFVWGQAMDEAVVRRAVEEELPAILQDLETTVPADGYLFGAPCVADIALAAFFRNAAFARYAIDVQRWPRSAAYVARVLEHPGFVALRAFEELSVRTPIQRQRDVLREAGAPLTATTYAVATPRRGIMTI